MILQKQLLRATIITFLFLFSQNIFSQCLQIESILVDACGQQEGLNEMVRFKVGTTSLNTNTMSVSWPNNSWQGLVKNAITASKTATLNADILDAGGCGQLIEPTAGILPANASVILVTSFNMDTDLNAFGALTDDIYILYQNNPSTASGHFANSGSGTRTLQIAFGGCSDTVSYDRALLISPSGATVAADGATVLFSASGQATYINNGCSAPVPPFTVDAGTSISACAGAVIPLNGTVQGQQSVQWSATTGSFSSATSLSTNYTISAAATGTVMVTLTATNSCGFEISDTVNINITTGLIPNFPARIEICAGLAAPTLNTVSPNGITGTWSPATINNTISGDYRFTPNANQCATPFILHVEITGGRIPDFPARIEICAGLAAPTLNTVSPNGIIGTWSPATINNTVSGDYRFMPNANQCATPFILHVEIAGGRIPDFPARIEICSGLAAPTLNTVSPNGITGNWTPMTINNTISGDYRFTPNANQCAAPFILHVEITTGNRIPDFPSKIILCSGETAPLLPTISPNGVVGTWNPSAIDNTIAQPYFFVPDSGQCASNFTLTVQITAFDFDIRQGCVDNKYLVEVIADSENSDWNYNWKNSIGNTISVNPVLNVTDLVHQQTVLFPETFELTVTNTEGCTANKKITVDGIFCNIPKGISPNHDGKNDTFDLTGLGVKQLLIFNRYGTQVYQCSNYTNQWNGAANSGELLPDATYYYVIHKNNGKNLTGWVYINMGLYK